MSLCPCSRRLLAVALLATASAAAEPMSLEACIQLALEHNTQILAARQGVLRSAADVTAARARRLPSVNTTLMSFSHSRTGPSVRVQENPTGEIDPVTGDRIFVEETTRIPGIDRSTYGLSAGMSHTLYDGGEGRHAHEAARQSLEAAELSLTASRAEIKFLVKERYFGLLKAQELVEVQTSALKLSQRRLEDSQSRLEVGATTRVDVLRLQVAEDNARAALINAEQQVVLARASLNHAMGRTLQAPLQTVPLADAVPTDVYVPPVDGDEAGHMEQLTARARQLNPDVEAMRRDVQAAEASLQAARAAWQPAVSGNLSYSRSNEVLDRVYAGFDQNYRINAGLSISYNLFDGGQRTAGIRRARSSLETARLDLEQQERNVALSVETTWLEVVRLGRILEIAQRTAELAEQDLRLAEERYRVGKGRLLEVLDAQVGLTEAASNRVNTRYDLAVAEADLERLVGETP